MARRVALLVATDRHDDPGLRRLTAPAADAEALAAVLRDPEIAGFEVTVLVNQPHHVVGPAIGDLYRDRRRDDVTLLYFTGHGLKDDHGRLYLATTNTRRDSLLFTSVPAEQIDQAMEGSTSRQKILILDCCYSGAFPSGRAVKADDEVHALERFQGRGRTVLTASDSTQYSFEGDRVTGSATRSVFTHHLVQGLRTGDADLDADGDITVDELYSYVHDKVVEEQPRQRPKKQTDVEGRAVIARNVAWTLPGYLHNAILSPIATDRLGALDGLVHLHRVGNPSVREQVTAEIERLTRDDSRAVSAAAATRLATMRPPAPEEPAPEPLPEAEASAEVAPTPEPPEPDHAGRPWRWRRPRPVIIIGAAVAAVGTAVALALTALTPTGYPSTGPIATVVDTVAVGDAPPGSTSSVTAASPSSRSGPVSRCWRSARTPTPSSAPRTYRAPAPTSSSCPAAPGPTWPPARGPPRSTPAGRSRTTSGPSCQGPRCSPWPPSRTARECCWRPRPGLSSWTPCAAGPSTRSRCLARSSAWRPTRARRAPMWRTPTSTRSPCSTPRPTPSSTRS
ncbi:hypothetical protein BJF78_33455 [Pseudonocardia sp. CNS-139]|nr:hypothetical protein BJF78_33455 [Pseudonocardia sp. CNS-139]